MASNDTLDLILDDPDVVAWDRITPMVRQLESTLQHAVVRVANHRGVPLGTFLPGSPGRTPENTNPKAAIAGPVRSGSAVIPFLFIAQEIHTSLLATPMQMATGLNTDDLKQWLSTLADVADLFDFAIGYVFGRTGVFAKIRDTQEPAETSREAMQGRLADMTIDEARGWLDDLTTAAERLQCGSVKISYRGMTIELIQRDLERSHTNLGVAVRREPLPGPGILPSGLVNLQRESEPIRVEVDGLECLAFKTAPTLGYGDFIAVWKSKAPLPQKGQPYEAQGSFVERRTIRPLEAVPPTWRTANGVFVVTSARSAAWL